MEGPCGSMWNIEPYWTQMHPNAKWWQPHDKPWVFQILPGLWACSPVLLSFAISQSSPSFCHLYIARLQVLYRLMGVSWPSSWQGHHLLSMTDKVRSVSVWPRPKHSAKVSHVVQSEFLIFVYFCACVAPSCVEIVTLSRASIEWLWQSSRRRPDSEVQKMALPPLQGLLCCHGANTWQLGFLDFMIHPVGIWIQDIGMKNDKER